MKNKSTRQILIAAVITVLMLAVTAICKANGVTFNATFWSLVPAVVAIALALITKEAYSSLFIGVLLGAFMVSGCAPVQTIETVTVNGLTNALVDNAGLYVFMALLGIIVALINKSGASRSFGEWAQTHVKTARGAQLATFFLGVLIFIDDYFNCLTVGTVMMPVTDRKRISRVKLAYLIDATAAPICMLAPVSSWAAAVSGCVESSTYSGFELFVRAIPYNFYSLYTLVFIVTLVILGFDYGKMAGYEVKAQQEGELFAVASSMVDPKEERKVVEEGPVNPHKGRLIDLVFAILVLIGMCIWGLVRNGAQALDHPGTLAEIFSETDSYVGLPFGAVAALVIIVVYLLARRVVSFKDAMDAIPVGVTAMLPSILILILATSLKTMTNAMEAREFVKIMLSNAEALTWALPAIIFAVACVIAFATGTSWGTFGILIPIVTAIFPESSALFFVGISACLAGAVCGDHISPISDTTIMSSAGAQCDHITHVTTQIPYALTVAAISFVNYLVAGLLEKVGLAVLSIPLGAVAIVVFLVLKKASMKKKPA